MRYIVLIGTVVMDLTIDADCLRLNSFLFASLQRPVLVITAVHIRVP
jgi:hypothetical protein